MPLAAYARVVDGHVLRVSDGDTLTAVIGGRQTTLRLLYIDAPERDQRFGPESTRSLEQLVRLVHVRFDLRGRDKYRRTLALIVRVSDGAVINLQQVERGMAWSIARGETEIAYERAQLRARLAHKGLWEDPRPVAPGVWRRSRRANR